MIEMVSRPHFHSLQRFADGRDDIYVLSADLTASCEADGFRDRYPERFLSLGMGEQNMISFAGGLAREGLKPYVHTFAVFICRRPFDQVAMSIAYPNLPVRLIGFLPGLTTPGGVTHQAIDDIALMRALPNMTIIDCGDATDVESVLAATDEVPGPVYIRMLRGQVPRLFPISSPLELGKVRVISEGSDVLVITSGICTGEALRVIPALKHLGFSLGHIHVSTIKPLNDQRLLSAIKTASYGVITLENHSIIGGLGSAVAELMAEAGTSRRLVRLGIKDTYAHGASRDYLMGHYGLDARALLINIEELVGRKSGLSVSELELVAQEQGNSRVEDL